MLFVLMTLFISASAVTPTTCSLSDDCRTYTDTTATCVGGLCECTAPDTTDLCSANTTDTVATGVTFVLIFNFECDRFFTSSTLENKIRVAIELTISKYEITLEVTFSCGSMNVLITGDVPVSSVATISADVTANVEAAVVDTEMQNTLLTSGVTTDSGSSAAKCSVTSPAATASYVSSSDSCTVTSCVSGYELQTNAPDYIATCVEVEVTSDDDDDLSDGTIAAIVLGSVAVCVLIAAAAYIAFAKKPQPTEEAAESIKNEPFEDVVV